jgi:hypothetical protein
MTKTEVYSWRLAPERKSALEAEARAAGKTVAEVLDELSAEWLATRRTADDEAEQRRLHQAAAKFVGVISGDDPNRSGNVSTLMRQTLRRKYGR